MHACFVIWFIFFLWYSLGQSLLDFAKFTYTRWAHELWFIFWLIGFKFYFFLLKSFRGALKIQTQQFQLPRATKFISTMPTTLSNIPFYFFFYADTSYTNKNITFLYWVFMTQSKLTELFMLDSFIIHLGVNLNKDIAFWCLIHHFYIFYSTL